MGYLTGITYKHLLQPQTCTDSTLLPSNQLSHQPYMYIHQVHSEEKIGVKPSAPLQDALAFLVDFYLRS